MVPPIKPAWELHLRDGVVTLGGDGNYYLTGSSGDNIWAWAEGIELWKSADLHNWEYLGLVWDIDKEADDWVKHGVSTRNVQFVLFGHLKFITSKAIISSVSACARMGLEY